MSAQPTGQICSEPKLPQSYLEQLLPARQAKLIRVLPRSSNKLRTPVKVRPGAMTNGGKATKRRHLCGRLALDDTLGSVAGADGKLAWWRAAERCASIRSTALGVPFRNRAPSGAVTSGRDRNSSTSSSSMELEPVLAMIRLVSLWARISRSRSLLPVGIASITRATGLLHPLPIAASRHG
jgi:hypothetical protein